MWVVFYWKCTYTSWNLSLQCRSLSTNTTVRSAWTVTATVCSVPVTTWSPAASAPSHCSTGTTPVPSVATISQRSSGCITRDILHLSQWYHRDHLSVSLVIYSICHNDITEIIWVYHSWYTPPVTTISQRSSGCITRDILHLSQRYHRDHPGVSFVIYSICHNDITEIIQVYHSWYTPAVTMISQRSSGCITHDVLHMSQRYHKDHLSVSLVIYSICHNDITEIIWVYHSWYTPPVTTISQRSSGCITRDILHLSQRYHRDHPGVSLVIYSSCHNDITEIIRVYHSWCTPYVTTISQRSSECITHDVLQLSQRYHKDHPSVSLMMYSSCHNDITEIIRVYQSWYTHLS